VHNIQIKTATSLTLGFLSIVESYSCIHDRRAVVLKAALFLETYKNDCSNRNYHAINKKIHEAVEEKSIHGEA
jgi:hypothetical protein